MAEHYCIDTPQPRPVTYRLAYIVEERPVRRHSTVNDARMAAPLLNAIRRELELPPFTHVCVYVNEELLEVRPLAPGADRSYFGEE